MHETLLPEDCSMEGAQPSQNNLHNFWGERRTELLSNRIEICRFGYRCTQVVHSIDRNMQIWIQVLRRSNKSSHSYILTSGFHDSLSNRSKALMTYTTREGLLQIAMVTEPLRLSLSPKMSLYIYYSHFPCWKWKSQGDIRDVISIGKLVRESDGPEQIGPIIKTMMKYGGYVW
jgi:hypothetical protein